MDTSHLIQINKSLKALIPPLSEEELLRLESSVIEEGIREALIVWEEKSILLDGHHRYALAEKHGLEYEVKRLSFGSSEDATVWMLNNQLGRRNLTPDQRRILIGRRYNSEKQQGRRTDLTSDQNEQKLT